MILSVDAPSVEEATEDEAREWLKGYNADMQNIMSTAAAASWAYNTNLTKHNQNLSVSSEDDTLLFSQPIIILGCGSSAVECRTRHQESPVSNSRCYRFVLSVNASCINDLAIDSGGNVSDLVISRNCCAARMLPGEVELVSE